ncbi:patatin-like phospholipase family protein [bacterium]|nr:patatin-like phospholipase family protein [bacterium]
MKSVGIALGGGGARGLCHIRFLKVLDELGVRPGIVAGSSIGALIGAFYASGFSADDMLNLLEKIGIRQITRMVDLSPLNPKGLVKGNGIARFLKRHLPAKRFEDLRIPLKVIATDFWSQKEVVLDSGELVPAIRASISIPAVFEAVRLGDRVLVDGGIVNPVPYDVIREACEILIAVDVTGTQATPGSSQIPSLFENLFTTIQTLQIAILRNKMKVVKPDITIKPALTGVGLLDFEKTKTILSSVDEDCVALRKELEQRLKKERRFLFFKYGGAKEGSND